MSIYRVTPKRGKWIVLRKADRKTMSNFPFATKTEAKQFMANLDAAEAVKENKINQVAVGGLRFVDAFANFAEAKKNENSADKGIRQSSANRYDTTYRLRIKKYMDHNVLLSEFGNKHMKEFLIAASDDGVPYKSLINTVKDIKYFLREANADGLNPNMSMTTFQAHKFGYIKPKDDDARFTKEVEILDDAKILQMLVHLKSEFGKNTNSTNTFAIVCLLFLFGLRASELSALKKANVDLKNMLLHVKGVYIPSEGGYLNQTKNRGSRRSIPIDANAAKFLTEWLEYLEENYKYSIWLLPSDRGNGPLGYKYINAHIWKAYAAMGLADITVRRDGHVVINSSPLKGSPTKMFRHRLASHLIAAMNKFGVLSQNQVKSIVGHTQFSTTAGIYGNKLVAMSNQARSEVAAAKETATNADLISQVISKNN